METTIEKRIDGKLAGDRNWSVIALLLLWALYIFVFWKMRPYIGEPEVFWSLVIGGGLVLLFNTAAVIAMVAHLSEDRQEIYGLDIHYLDLAKNKSI